MMGSRLNRRRNTRSIAPATVSRRLATGTLALLVGLAPSLPALGDTSTATPSTIPAPTTNNQAGAQQNAGSTNNMASMLGEAAGVLSMASGGLYMAKGVQELSCCVQGCNTGAGGTANTAATQQQVDANAAAKTIPNQGASPNLLSAINPFSAGTGGGNGCIDGALALATGGLMMLNGIMGLAAASQAGQNGSSAMGNAGNMGAMPTGPGITGSTTDSTASVGVTNSSLGGGNDAGGTIKLDPALLRTGLADNIMGQFENKFGIPRDAFSQGVLNGQDPRSLLSAAPSNALSNADMNKAISAAQNMTDAQKDTALAGTQLAAAQKELAGEVDAGGGGTRSPASKDPFAKTADLDPIAGLESTSTAAAIDPGVSPEVRAALLARQKAETAKVDWETLSLFERVHGKYREKAKMIFGYDPDAVLKGVGNANGT